MTNNKRLIKPLRTIKFYYTLSSGNSRRLQKRPTFICVSRDAYDYLSLTLSSQLEPSHNGKNNCT